MTVKEKPPNVYVIRLSQDWVEFRAADKKPEKVITYFTNKLLAQQAPKFRLRNVAWEGGQCLGADKFQWYEAFCDAKDLTIPKVDESLKLPKEFAGLFLEKKWRKIRGIY